MVDRNTFNGETIMNDQKFPIAVRAYPVIETKAIGDGAGRTYGKERRNREPTTALIFDCETRTDIPQRLTVGFAVEIKSYWKLNQHHVIRVICFADEGALSTPERLTVSEWMRALISSKLKALDIQLQYLVVPEDLSIEYQLVSAFRETFYRVGHEQRGAIVGFNLPFDISRIADSSGIGRRDKQAHVFTLIPMTDSRGRKGTKQRHPRVSIRPIDGRRAIIGFSGSVKRERGYFIDLKTLGDALTGSRHSLASACKTFGVQHKTAHHHGDGMVTRNLLDYGLNDALISAELYIAQMNEFRMHPIEKTANQIHSEASIGKEYLKKVGLRLPSVHVAPDVDLQHAHHPAWEPLPAIDPANAVQGFATSTYFGGRTECRIRKSIVPVVYVDFLSMYPTCNTLMGLWEYLTAEIITASDATQETQELLDRITADDLFNHDTWKKLAVIVEVIPDGDVLPTRTKYGDEIYSAYSIGVNPLSADKPMWWTLSDCIASKLRTGRPPRVRRALRFVPVGKQHLKPVSLRGQVEIDPNTQDFFRDAILERREARNPNGKYKDIATDQRDRLQKFIKNLINATSYGIYMEMNRQDGEESHVQAHGLRVIEREVSGPEKLGDYCFPILSTLITGAARLMLELASYEVRRRGGTYAFMDTDSLAIVATENGGPIDQFGVHHMDTHALSRSDIAAVLDRFRSLNPYGDWESILEKESENYAQCGISGHGSNCTCTCTGVDQQLYVYSVASKRYALFDIDENNLVNVRKYSEHGLGAYRAPIDPKTKQFVSDWQRTLWDVLITRQLTGDLEMPDWAGQTALTSIRVSTHEHMKWFKQFNSDSSGKEVPYESSVKPFNFMVHALINGSRSDHKLCLVAPMGTTSGYINRYAPLENRYVEHIDFKPKIYRDVILSYDMHPERKFTDSTGAACRPNTRGLLLDQDVRAGKIVHIGKEGNSLEESRADLQTEPERQLEYGDSEHQDFLREYVRFRQRSLWSERATTQERFEESRMAR
jgi:hypothetical protein